MKVAEYISPEKFAAWKLLAEQLGFLYVASGPLVRSSYKAGEAFIENVLKQRKVEGMSAAEGGLRDVNGVEAVRELLSEEEKQRL